MKKKFASIILAISMCLSFVPSAFAADSVWNDDSTGTVLYEATENDLLPPDFTEDDSGIMPLNNYQIIKNEDITTDGTDWVQPFGYGSYKIWIENSTDEEMTIVHTAGFKERQYKVPAHENKVVFINNSALPNVSHVLDFSIPSGAASGDVLGRVAVRVSTVDQYYD